MLQYKHFSIWGFCFLRLWVLFWIWIQIVFTEQQKTKCSASIIDVDEHTRQRNARNTPHPPTPLPSTPSTPPLLSSPLHPTTPLHSPLPPPPYAKINVYNWRILHKKLVRRDSLCGAYLQRIKKFEEFKYVCRQGSATINVMPTNGIRVQIKKNVLKPNNTPFSASIWHTLQWKNALTSTQASACIFFDTPSWPPPPPSSCTGTSVFLSQVSYSFVLECVHKKHFEGSLCLKRILTSNMGFCCPIFRILM